MPARQLLEGVQTVEVQQTTFSHDVLVQNQAAFLGCTR